MLMDKLRDRIAWHIKTFYNTVGEVEGEANCQQSGCKNSGAESQGTLTRADRGLGRGEGRYTGGKTSTPADEDTCVRQLLK